MGFASSLHLFFNLEFDLLHNSHGFGDPRLSWPKKSLNIPSWFLLNLTAYSLEPFRRRF